MLKALVTKDQATVHEMLPKLGQTGGDPQLPAPPSLPKPPTLPKLGEPIGDIYDTGLKVVVPDSSSPLKPDMFDTKTQVLPLGEFRQWLEKYKLTGS